jgi:hypothetical protein
MTGHEEEAAALAALVAEGERWLGTKAAGGDIETAGRRVDRAMEDFRRAERRRRRAERKERP